MTDHEALLVATRRELRAVMRVAVVPLDQVRELAERVQYLLRSRADVMELPRRGFDRDAE